MPPNLLVKAAFVRGELESIDKPFCEENESIRTDFILQNIYSYVVRHPSDFNAVRAKNKKEEFVLKELKETVNAFKSSFIDKIKNLCLELEVTENTIGTVIFGVSNELFCEGITWSRIVSLFVFIGELTLLCLSTGFSRDIVDEIYECFCRFVKEKLKGWVDDHGGWEGLTALSVTQGHIESTQGHIESTQGHIESTQGHIESTKPSESNSGWAKSLLYSTVRMVGTLAHIANSSGHALP